MIGAATALSRIGASGILNVVVPPRCFDATEATAHRSTPMLVGLDILVPATVTDVVFVFLCSKPVFVLSALVAGLVANYRADGEHPEQLPDRG